MGRGRGHGTAARGAPHRCRQQRAARGLSGGDRGPGRRSVSPDDAARTGAAAAMSDRFKRPKAKVADAAAKLFLARLEAIDVILDGAEAHEVLMVCAHALAQVAPDCCEEHVTAFAAELARLLREAIELQQDAEDAAVAEDDTPPVRH